MLAKAIILEQADYDKWFTSLKDSVLKAEPDGYLLLRNTGCIACHSLDGAKLVGPSFKGLYGKERTVVAGNKEIKVTADEKYIQNSIYNPDSEIVSGFPKGLMKSYTELLRPEDVKTITDYLKTLNEAK
jgi:cytochrome c oxidase subunit 2